MSYGFSRWGGGLDFIRHILTSILLVDADEAHEYYLVIPGDDFSLRIRRILYPLRGFIKQLITKEKFKWEKYPTFNEKYLVNSFIDLLPRVKFVVAGASYKSQLDSIARIAPDVVLPCIQHPGRTFNFPVVGYLFDFQHKYLTDLFSDQECQQRDIDFSAMLENSEHIIVNACAVKMDAEYFIKDFPAKIHVLPFSPCAQKSWLDSPLDVRAEYKLSKSYFMICNQFWKHKDHITAFKGFARYIDQGGIADLVCTGGTSDYRFPEYFAELQDLILSLGIKERVKILGHISKEHQVSLIKYSQGMIQCTLFEGGPGGGAAYDAIALGVPVIASDIAVNREMNCGNVVLFEAQNPASLAEMLLQNTKITKQHMSAETLWEQGLARKSLCGKFIFAVAQQAIDDFNRKKKT